MNGAMSLLRGFTRGKKSVAQTLFNDQFTGGAATGLAAHAPITGGAWTVQSGTPTLNGSGQVSAAAAWFATTDTGRTDGTLILTILSNAIGRPRVIFRLTDANNYWYVDLDSTGNLRIFEVVAGTPTQRGTTNVYILAGADFITVTVRGSQVTATVGNGNPTIAYASMASGLAATKHGIGDVNGNATLDRFIISS